MMVHWPSCLYLCPSWIDILAYCTDRCTDVTLHGLHELLVNCASQINLRGGLLLGLEYHDHLACAMPIMFSEVSEFNYSKWHLCQGWPQMWLEVLSARLLDRRDKSQSSS
jgi:hypothetical protein